MRSRSSRCSPKLTESDIKAIQGGIHRVAEVTHPEFDSGRLEHAAEESSEDGGNDVVGEMLQHARREHEFHVYVIYRYEHLLTSKQYWALCFTKLPFGHFSVT